MVYLPLKPASGDNLSDSQGDIQQNFQTANTVMDINHYPFDNATTSKGKHKYVQFPVDINPSTAVPPVVVTGSTELLLYNGLSGTYNLYFIPPSTAIPGGGIQLTRNEAPVAAGTGFSWMPGGILIQWGTATKVTDGAVSFSPSFSAVPYSVQITVFEPNNNRHFVSVKTTSISGFTVSSRDSSGADESNTFFWIAIGK